MYAIEYIEGGRVTILSYRFSCHREANYRIMNIADAVADRMDRKVHHRVANSVVLLPDSEDDVKLQRVWVDEDGPATASRD